MARALRDDGVDERGVARSPERWDSCVLTGVAFATADLLDVASLTEAFSGYDAVVANAALGSHQGDLADFVRTNVTGTANTLRAAAPAGARRVVMVSSTAVYLTPITRPITESHERYGSEKRWFSWTHLSTDWRYAVSKHLAEETAGRLAAELGSIPTGIDSARRPRTPDGSGGFGASSEAPTHLLGPALPDAPGASRAARSESAPVGMCLTILRPGPIYGSRDPKWTARMLRAVIRPYVLVPTVGVPAVDAGDVSGAVAAALRTAGSIGRAYTIAGPPVPLVEVYATLVRLGAGRAHILPLPVPIAVRYDTTSAVRDLGFVSRSVEAGMREVIEG